MLVFKNHIHQSPRRLRGGQTPAFEEKMVITVNPWEVQMLGVADSCVTLGWLQLHGVKEARHLAGDFS